MNEIAKDKRFAHIENDPRFRPIPKRQRRVQIDTRFQSMFKDEQFQTRSKVDKRGRPVQHSTDEDLRRYYELSSEDESEDDSDDSTSGQEESGRYVRAPKEELNEKSEPENIPDVIKKKLRDLNVDYARGEGKLLSDSSSDDATDSDESEELDEDGVEHDWGQLDKGAETTEEATHRLAACNMDWDRIRATDLMVLFNSFLPAGGVIHSITIYPSEFGIERMREEEINGPMELVTRDETVKNADGADEHDEETEEGSKYHMEKLRQYQLNRLKYYYAVIVCDGVPTANKIYSECDGLEYESSATKLDLRFIPDDTTFDQEAKEECKQLPDMTKYQPRYFTTTALQQAKVELTWDETNPERAEVALRLQSGKLDDVTDTDLQNYLAISSESEMTSDEETPGSDNDVKTNGDEEKIDKYKALLLDIERNEDEKKNRDVEMEISWGVNLKEKTDKLAKQRLSAGAAELTPFEQFMEKKREKRKVKKAERLKKIEKSKRGSDESTEEENPYSDDDIPSDIDMNDPYFAEEFNNSEFKKPKKEKKIKEGSSNGDKQKNAELELLLMDEDDNKKHFSLKKIQEHENETKSKRKKKYKKKENVDIPTDDFNLNVNDDRFAALYNSHHFNIDPADPHFRKTKAMETLIQEKLKRRTAECQNLEPKLKIARNEISRKNNAELNVLVKSVKIKSQGLKKRR